MILAQNYSLLAQCPQKKLVAFYYKKTNTYNFMCGEGGGGENGPAYSFPPIDTKS